LSNSVFSFVCCLRVFASVNETEALADVKTNDYVVIRSDVAHYLTLNEDGSLNCNGDQPQIWHFQLGLLFLSVFSPSFFVMLTRMSF
jgi:hypothetical protein